MKGQKLRFRPRFQHCALVICALYSVLGLQMTGAAKALIGQAQSEPEIRLLVPGKPVERQIAGGESHIYRVKLTAGQFVRLIVEQKGIDVAVQLMTPEGKPLIEAEFTGPFGQESLCQEVAVGGDYRIVIRTVAATAPKGAYDAKLEVRAVAVAQDKQRIDAERLLAEAVELGKPG